jgi:hypothetical protein
MAREVKKIPAVAFQLEVQVWPPRSRRRRAVGNKHNPKQKAAPKHARALFSLYNAMREV